MKKMFYKKETVFMEHTLLKHEREREKEWGDGERAEGGKFTAPQSPPLQKEVAFYIGEELF